ncbi:MAG: response regulator [Clostridia bacterium]|nr:response regulator [Clostridia bacterium]
MGMSSIAIANINDAKLVENCLKKISVSSRQLMELVNELSDIPVTESDETPLNFAEAQEGQPGENGQKAKEVDLKGKRILVAEDNDLNWEIAELLLTSEGFEVEHAENGQTCVDMLLAHKAGYYDAILMDVRMPVMSGLEATTVIRGLKKAYRGIPIIAMTADAFAEDMQKCLECGMNAHIAKPIDIEVVKSTLAKYIIKKD